MVKQLDDPGIKGADPVFKNFRPGKTAPCSRRLQPGERYIKRWAVYFIGVKENLVFVDAADGLNGAMEFQVFDPRTGVKVFHDQRYVPSVEELRTLNFFRTTTGQIGLRYQRAFFGSCSIPTHGLGCWHKFQQQTGLMSTPMPACRKDDGDGHDYGDDPSVIFYRVETTLLPKPKTKVIGPIERCTPQD